MERAHLHPRESNVTGNKEKYLIYRSDLSKAGWQDSHLLRHDWQSTQSGVIERSCYALTIT